MPRLFGRLWRSGGRRAELPEAGPLEVSSPPITVPAPDSREDIGRRLEEARQRLRKTIPSPEDPESDPRDGE